MHVNRPVIPARSASRSASRRPLLSLLAGAALLSAMLMGPGCSQDKHRFSSRIDSPKTVRVVEAYSGAVLWERQIPPGRDLVLDIDRPKQGLPGVDFIKNVPPVKLSWVEYDTLAKYRVDRELTDKGEMSLPGSDVRIELEIRPAPEYPSNFIPPQPYQAPEAEPVPARPIDAMPSTEPSTQQDEQPLSTTPPDVEVESPEPSEPQSPTPATEEEDKLPAIDLD